jgi:hypothetical protein
MAFLQLMNLRTLLYVISESLSFMIHFDEVFPGNTDLSAYSSESRSFNVCMVWHC